MVLWVFTAAAVAPVHEHSGGSFPVEARLLETDRFAVGSCDVVVVLVILTTFTVIAAV